MKHNLNLLHEELLQEGIENAERLWQRYAHLSASEKEKGTLSIWLLKRCAEKAYMALLNGSGIALPHVTTIANLKKGADMLDERFRRYFVCRLPKIGNLSDFLENEIACNYSARKIYYIDQQVFMLLGKVKMYYHRK